MTCFVLRQGESIRADEAFFAWTSGDLERMIAALAVRTNPIDRHFLLQSIVSLSYRGRRTPQLRTLCRKVGEIHKTEFPTIAPRLKADMGGVMPRVTTFTNLATVLAEDGEYDKAIEVCEFAIACGLNDGTTGGYSSRIARIRRREIKAHTTEA